MTKEVTVGLRIKAFLTEARTAVRDFQKELKAVGDTATQTGAKMAAASGGARFMNPAELRNMSEGWKQFRAGAVPALKETDDLLKKGTISAKQHAMAMRQLPAQITDIATSLASGMPPWLVFIQQGGQIRDSFGGGTTALKGMMSVLTPLRLAIGGVAGAVVGMMLAYKNASDEQDTFVRAIEMSGNAAGVTTDQIEDMATAISRLGGTRGKAAEALTDLAASGEVGRANLEQFAATAVKTERIAGQSIGETAKAFAELAKSPLQATLKFNDSLHYLTAELYDQIKALMKRGEVDKAAEIAQRAYAKALDERTTAIEPKLSSLTRAWLALSEAATKAGNSMAGALGLRAPTMEEQIASQQKTVQELEKQLASRQARGMAVENLPERLGAARNRLQDLSQDKEEQASLARTRGEAAKVAEEYAKARENTERWRDAAKPLHEQLNDKLTEYRVNLEKLRAAGVVIPPSQVAREERAIRESIMGSDLDNFRSRAGIDQAKLQAELTVLQAAVRQGDDIIVQALKDGKLTIDAAYSQRLAQLQEQTQKERQVYEKQLADLDKEMALARTPQERNAIQQKRIEIQASVKVLDLSLADSSRKLEEWRKGEVRRLSDIEAKVRVDVSQLTGKFDREAVRAQIQESMRPDYAAAQTEKDPDTRARTMAGLDMMGSAALAQAEFNAKLAESQRLQGQLSVAEGAIQAEQQRGAISQIEAEGRLQAARAAQVPILERTVAELRAIRDAMPADAVVAIEGMNQQIGELENTVKRAKPEVIDLGTQLKVTFQNSVGDWVATAITDFKSLRGNIASTLKQIAADILRSGINRALAQQFGGGGGGVPPNPFAADSGGGGFLGTLFSIGKSLFGFAEGGLIRGPGTGTSDSIPALVGGRRPIAVSNNEFIQPERAVKHYGLGFMEAIRTLRVPKDMVPRFNFGGLVSAQQRARFATGGSVGTGAGGAAGSVVVPQVVVQVVNNGTAQRVTSQNQQFDGKQLVVSVMLDDLARNGPITQAMGRR